jgi:hypothetical protein
MTAAFPLEAPKSKSPSSARRCPVAGIPHHRRRCPATDVEPLRNYSDSIKTDLILQNSRIPNPDSSRP